MQKRPEKSPATIPQALPSELPSDADLLSRLIIGIGEVAKICDVPIRQLRYWEMKEIIQSVEPGATVRCYSFSTIKRILLIKELLDEGYTLDAAASRVHKRIEAIDQAFRTLAKSAKRKDL